MITKVLKWIIIVLYTIGMLAMPILYADGIGNIIGLEILMIIITGIADFFMYYLLDSYF